MHAQTNEVSLTAVKSHQYIPTPARFRPFRNPSDFFSRAPIKEFQIM